MIISTRRILLATDDQTNKGGKLIYPGSNIILKIVILSFFQKLTLDVHSC